MSIYLTNLFHHQKKGIYLAYYTRQRSYLNLQDEIAIVLSNRKSAPDTIMTHVGQFFI